MSESPQQTKLPVNLVEALGPTPLTYLVPSQNLPSLTNFKDASIPIARGLSLPPWSSDPKSQQLRQVLKEELVRDYNQTSIRFEQVDRPFVESTVTKGNSLYSHLSPFAQDVIDRVPLVEEDSILKDDLEALEQPSIVQTSISEATNKHRLSTSPAADSTIQIKKRKSDISVYPDEMKKMAVERLSDLLIKKIGLTDEDTEYEHSDIWMEWPDSSHCLSEMALAEIEEHLSKLKDAQVIECVPLEVLSRIQFLALKPIRAASEMDWISMGLPGLDSALTYATLALRAASIILLIFNSKREDKSLQMENYLVEILSFIYTFVEDYLIRIIKLENSAATAQMMGHMDLIAKTFNQFSIYVPKNEINDTIITRLEYLTLLIIFTQGEKHLMLLKIASSTLLLSIFQNKKSQRSFIVDEVLNSFDSLPTHRITSRQFTTRGNISIQMFSFLVIKLVESINILNMKNVPVIPSVFPDVPSSEFDELSKDLSVFTETITETKSDIDQVLQSICSGLINKIINNPSPTCRLQFNLFVTDLLNIVKLPEFPGAESLLATIMNMLVVLPDTQQSLVETSLLETVGIIGSKMLEIRGLEECSDTNALLFKEKSLIFHYLSEMRSKEYENSSSYFFTEWVLSVATNLKESSDRERQLELSRVYFNLLRGFYLNYFEEGFIKPDIGPDIRQQVLSVYELVLRHSGFIGLYDKFLNHVLKLVDHPKIKSRTRALKNLALLVNRDPALLKIPQIKQCVSGKIHDSSPLVRLAVLDILDEYLLKTPEDYKDFYQFVVLTNDKSTAVRLKSLKLAERVFKETFDQEIKIYIIEKMFRRLEDDEESVLELAQATLMNLLFLPFGSNITDEMQFKKAARLVIEIHLAYINKNDRNWEFYENFLFTMILRETLLNLSSHRTILKFVESMIEELFCFVIQNIDSEVDVSQRLGLLSIFAKFEKPLISQEQLLSLQTYFTSDTSGTDVSLYSLIILRHTISGTLNLRSDFLEDCEASLLKRLTKLNSRELSQAVPSLASISVLRNDSSKLANAAASCLALISPYLDKASKGGIEKFDPRCARLIFLIGSFAKDCNFEKDRSIFEHKKLSIKEKESVLSYMVKNLVIFTRENVDNQLRKIAVKNLISVCSTHSNLFLNEPILKIFDNEFESDRIDFHEVIIQGLLEFLERQEKANFKKTRREKNSNNGSLDVDVFYGSAKAFENDGICASLVQRYIDPVLKLCLLEDGGRSLTAIKYFKFIVKKGFCNPRLCISTTIALQASPLQYIRSTSLELFTELFERYESLIDNSYVQGFKEAVQFRSRLSNSILEENHLFLSKFYSIIEDSKPSKRKMLNQLVKSLNFELDLMNLSDCKSLYNYVLFISMNLAECEFNLYEEVITLVDGIQSILGDQAMSLDKLIKKEKDALQQNEDETNNEMVIKIGYFCSIVISLERLLTFLRHSYKIFEDNEKLQELKSQRTKIQKTPLKLVTFDPSKDDVNILIRSFQAMKY